MVESRQVGPMNSMAVFSSASCGTIYRGLAFLVTRCNVTCTIRSRHNGVVYAGLSRWFGNVQSMCVVGKKYRGHHSGPYTNLVYLSLVLRTHVDVYHGGESL